MNYKAGIFDLDGVITQTAGTHAKAWKKMFDAYNQKRKNTGKETYKEFNINDDYPQYLDGVPRYQGVEAFLESRGIELPYGDESDEPKEETICGLGNHKNQMFLETVKNEGVEMYTENVETIKKWKQQGLKTAIISSSKNCKAILEKANLLNLFEVRVDGLVSKEKNLAGKPAPDIFLEAARQLGVEPSESFIVEDATSGVEAGRKGGFKKVIGINIKNNEKELYEHGAHVVVHNLGELRLDEEEETNSNNYSLLPNAYELNQTFARRWEDGPVLICFDYDGTLTPIVEDYTKAHLDDEMRNILNKLAQSHQVAVVSGRDTQFIKKEVGLGNIFYAGSHGFAIEGPDGFHYEPEEARALLPDLDKAESMFRDFAKKKENVLVERKKYALAIHFRQAKEELIPQIMQYAEKVVQEISSLKIGKGKKIIELKPKLDWHKGKAVEVLYKKLMPENTFGKVFYIGDDITDEDAFKTVKPDNALLVGDHGENTYAGFRLKDVAEVKAFLKIVMKKETVDL